ncbi:MULTISPECIES: APC family permease [unclassified Leucobacter]|uniref:APC family permease n=1 Tax=unclassified Leucobacter TaxID=2621730 RepID=UPI000A4C0035|nr:APC family permease [Leucobacter sp. Ag1]
MSTAAPETAPTQMALEESKHLQKTLGRFDIVFLVVAAVVSIEVLGQVAGYGGETFTWTLVLTVLFLVPYALIFAETGGAFTEEGGVYTWVRQAFGRFAGAIAAMLTWVTQPVWVGGTSAFIAVETWSAYVAPIDHGSFWDYGFKLIFIWVTVASAIVSLKHGKWLPTLGALLKVAFLAFFLVVTVIYGVQHGFQGLTASYFAPTLTGFLGLTPLLLFSFLGFESGNSAAGEMKNPGRDVPVSIARSAGIAAASYLLPILAILLVVPVEKIQGISGLFEAVATVFSIFGDGAGTMLTISAIVFIFVLMSQGGAWMIISDRMQAMAAADGSFFGGFFGKIHPGLGTPVRVNTMSGIVGTVFMLAAMVFVNGQAGALFQVVLTICISTFLMSYLFAIPAAISLRKKFPDVHRPYRVPVNDVVWKLFGVICTAWIALGTWVAIFPGTLEALFGVEYPFADIWGVDQGTFSVFTLSTLGVIVLIGVAGYLLGRRLRQPTEAIGVVGERVTAG